MKIFTVIAAVSALLLSCKGEELQPTAPAGCTRDDQCKGERICREGVCVEPSAPSKPTPDVRTEVSPAERFSPFPKVEAGDPAGLEMPWLGSKRPALLVVQTVDYECPHTRRAQPIMEALLKQHPDLAVCVLHNPLPEHPRAQVAAVAAAAAQRQGRFAEMHRALLQEEGLDRDRLLKLARTIGLDVPAFLQDLKDEKLRRHVERDRIVAAALGLPGTPCFYVGGTGVQGLPAGDRLRTLVEQRLAEGRTLAEQGRSPEEIHLALIVGTGAYEVVVTKGVDFDAAPKRRRERPRDVRWRVTRDEPWLGSKDALVTLVAWLDPACPHSLRQLADLARLAKAQQELRIEIRLLPRSLQEGSAEAVALVSAAPVERRFGLLRRVMEAGRSDRTLLLKLAEEAGLRQDEVQQALRPDALERLRLDARFLSERVGALGTPTLFVNGLRRVGYQEPGGLVSLVAAELEEARSLEERGLSRAGVYDRLTEGGKLESPVAREIAEVDLVDAQVLGSRTAPVRLAVFWDYDSPYCRKLMPHLDRVIEKMGKRAVIAFKQLPQPHHARARDAAKAAICAERLGSFDPYHRALLKRPPGLVRTGLVELAEKVGLKPDEFQRCLGLDEVEAQVKGHELQAGKINVKGVPVVFLNDHRYRSPSGLDADGLLHAIELYLR